MIDPRFFQRSRPLPLGLIGKYLGAELSDPLAAELMVADIGSLESADAGYLSVLYHSRYLNAFLESKAGAVVTSPRLARLASTTKPLLLTPDPRLAWAQIANLFYPATPLEAGIHRNATIDPSASIGPSCQIGPGVVIGRNVVLGARSHIGCNAVVEAGVAIGEDCCIGAGSTISHALIGSSVRVATGTRIGGPGFGFFSGPNGVVRMPQLGRVTIGDHVEIGANCTVDRGSEGDTVIGARTVLDNLVRVAHNVRLGRHCVIAGQVGIAGSAVIGDFVMIGGRACISDHLIIGEAARIAFASSVIRNVAPGETVGGYPAIPIRKWHRQTSGLKRLFGGKSDAPGGVSATLTVPI
jgi:UDP-3-O-[3-hydroxymyristoyl] glucosamine N-acyltransferase